jgi:hypothetical protein
MNDGIDSELTDFLKDEPEPAAEDTTDVDNPEEAAEQDDKNGEKTDDKPDSTTDDKAAESKDKQDDTDTGSPSEPENKETGTVPIAALLDEREKRQSYERRIEELEGKLNTKAEKPLPDVLENQEGFVSEMESRIKTETQSVRIEVSQDVMRMMHDDYDDMEKKFIELAKDSPDLVSKMSASKLPAKFVYDTAKKSEKLAEMDNLEEWEAKKTAELTAKIKADLEAEAKTKAEKDAETEGALSPSLAAQRGSGSGDSKPADVPDPLETTFNR